MMPSSCTAAAHFPGIDQPQNLSASRSYEGARNTGTQLTHPVWDGETSAALR
jgi:hypothetical protein